MRGKIYHPFDPSNDIKIIYLRFLSLCRCDANFWICGQTFTEMIIFRLWRFILAGLKGFQQKILSTPYYTK